MFEIQLIKSSGIICIFRLLEENCQPYLDLFLLGLLDQTMICYSICIREEFPSLNLWTTCHVQDKKMHQLPSMLTAL